MEDTLYLVKIPSGNALFEDSKRVEKMITLINRGFVTVKNEKFALTQNGEIALKVGIEKFDLLKQKEDLKKNLEQSDKSIYFFLTNWDKKRIIGLAIWIILIIIWVILQII